MKRKKLIYIVFGVFIILSIWLLIQYSRQFIWTLYKDRSKNFSISYPLSWTHEYDKLRSPMKFNMETGKYEYTNKYPIDRWYIEGPSKPGAGKFYGNELIIGVYDAPDKGLEDLYSRIASDSASYNARLTEFTIAGTQVKGYIQPPDGSGFSAGPLEHNGKFYYFSGLEYLTTDFIIKKVLPTFKFIK